MPAGAPGWHDSADCSQRAHNVGVELAVHQLVVDEFKGALYFETCVVDEDVDRPGIGQGVVDRLGTTHIEVTHLDVEALGCRKQVVALGKVAHRRDHVVSLLCECERSKSAEAAVAARDENACGLHRGSWVQGGRGGG